MQACAGHEAGCEAAVHAMRTIYVQEDIDAVLLVDATNAFNKINRKAALHNIERLCPPIACVLNNTYRAPVKLAEEKLNQQRELPMQGDSLAMAMYALADTPLIKKLREKEPDVKQVWFADDATAAGKLQALQKWWQLLTELGPSIGYHSNAIKTHFVVKPELLDEAKKLFETTNVQITTHGHRHLGAAIGTSSFEEEYIANKIKKWTTEISSLSKPALSQPQAAYASFVHGIVGR